MRYPTAARPWQHVLEPIAGHLALAEHLLGPEGDAFAGAWNFGPDPASDAAVGHVAERLAALWGDGASVAHDADGGHPHEAGTLRLDSTLARLRLGWRPRLDLDAALALTVDWHRAHARGEDVGALTRAQIARFLESDG